MNADTTLQPSQATILSKFITLLAEITNTSEGAIRIMPVSYLPTYLEDFLAIATVSERVRADQLLQYLT